MSPNQCRELIDDEGPAYGCDEFASNQLDLPVYRCGKQAMAGSNYCTWHQRPKNICGHETWDNGFCTVHGCWNREPEE